MKAETNFLQHLLISKDADRHADLMKISSHEPSPVPLSLADTSNTERLTNKAVLEQILQSATTVEKQLSVTNLKICDH